MRYLIYFISLCFFSISCQNGKKTNKSSMSKDTVINGNISLEVIPNTLERDRIADISIVYIVNNKTSYSIQYDTRYKIEKYTGSRWEQLPFKDNIAFEDLLYSLEPTNSQEFKVAIPKILKSSTIDAGTYRIVKEVWPENREHKKTTLTTEFTVK